MGDDGRLCAVFNIVKPNGTQVITFSLPVGITISDVQKAWEEAGEAWTQVWVKEGQPFVALRTFVVAPEVTIVWHVFHFDDKPYDACSVNDTLDVPALVAALSS